MERVVRRVGEKTGEDVKEESTTTEGQCRNWEVNEVFEWFLKVGEGTKDIDCQLVAVVFPTEVDLREDLRSEYKGW